MTTVLPDLNSACYCLELSIADKPSLFGTSFPLFGAGFPTPLAVVATGGRLLTCFALGTLGVSWLEALDFGALHLHDSSGVWFLKIKVTVWLSGVGDGCWVQWNFKDLGKNLRAGQSRLILPFGVSWRHLSATSIIPHSGFIRLV
jgi:hypothetical protein